METSGPSSKRRRLANERSSSPSTPPPKNVRIKQEDPDSPLPQRRMVTSGSRRYLIPNDCEKGQPNFKHNRQAWSKREADVLRSRGFKPVRMFIREDGMVIDWESSVLVWSDTLQPVGTDLASVIQHAHAANDRSNGSQKMGTLPNPRSGKRISTGVSPPNRKQLPPPPRPLPSARVPNAAAQSALLPLPTPSNRSPRDVNDHNQRMARNLGSDAGMNLTETFPTSRSVEMNANSENVAGNKADELQMAALGFLEQYIKTFDEDRSDLASAYSHNAVFSYRVHEMDAATTSSSSEAFASKVTCRDTSGSDDAPLGVKQSHIEIVTALLSLGSSHKFCTQGDATVAYDFVYLDPSHDVLLICYAEIVDIRRGHKLSLDQSFVLRKKEHDEDDRLSEGLWPLVAISHQMTIRDVPAPAAKNQRAKA